MARTVPIFRVRPLLAGGLGGLFLLDTLNSMPVVAVRLGWTAGLLLLAFTPPPSPLPLRGRGGLKEASSAALLGRRVGVVYGGLTLVLFIWKAEIRFLALEATGERLGHSFFWARI